MYRPSVGEGENEDDGLLPPKSTNNSRNDAESNSTPTANHRYDGQGCGHQHFEANLLHQQRHHMMEGILGGCGDGAGKDLEKGTIAASNNNNNNNSNSSYLLQNHSSSSTSAVHHRMEFPKAKKRRLWPLNCCLHQTSEAASGGGSIGAMGQNGQGIIGSWSDRWGKGRRWQQPRLVDKNGECIILPNNLRGSFGICFRNWFHLVIEHSWRRIFLLFAGGFMTSWFSFGLIYYFIQHFSGDMQNLSEQRQCIANVHSLTSAFLFSLESQHTIGYGTRYMTEICPFAYATLSVQCIVGVLLQTILAGIVIAKILRPKKRKQEMRFSTQACIGPVDDEDQRPALMIRLADIQHRLYIAESHVRLYMATTKINKHGDCELIGVQDMNVGYDTGMDRVLLLWPVVIRHIIDQDSPLWEITEEKLKTCQFELIMTVEGIVEATGMAFQARTSFLPDEILWAQRFVPLIALNQKTNQFEVDYDLFDVTEPHPLEAWLPPDEDDYQPMEQFALDESSVPPTKLSVISELNSAVPYAVHNNGTVGGGQPQLNIPNGFIPSAESPIGAHHGIPPPLPPPIASEFHHAVVHGGQFRRKSNCSIAESIRSGKFYPPSSPQDEMMHEAMLRPNTRKTSRSSLFHVLLRRTQTNDSSPLVSNNNQNCPAGEEGGAGDGQGTLSPGGPDGLSGACSPLPASPFVIHTLQHSGFT